MPRSVDQVLNGAPSARRLSLFMVGCVLAVDLIWLPFSALRIDADNVLLAMCAVGLCFVAGPLQRRFELPEWMANFIVEIYILVLFAIVGFILSYMAVEGGSAVRDDFFVSLDMSLGFDWRAYTSFFLQNDWLRAVSFVAYVLAPLLVVFSLFWFCLDGNFNRASELVAMVILGGLLCVVISGMFPSLGGSGHFPTGDIFYRGYSVIFDGSSKSTFYQLRDGAGMDVRLVHPVPLIAFPSYHACMALLVALFRWGKGLKGRITAILSLGSLFSLPIDGGHHLSDVLGGLLVGVAAFWVVRQVGNIACLRLPVDRCDQGSRSSR